jgi:CheY-like chemotaxis protein
MAEAAPRILIVDDDDQIRRLYSKLLTRAGMSIAEVASAKAAVTALASEHFDLVVLDLCMPETDGFDLLHQIRNTLPQQKTLVISGAMSGSMAGTMLHMAGHFGATATLEKVLAPSLLVQAVFNVLSKSA